VRAILGITFLLVGVAMLSCQVDGPQPPAEVTANRSATKWVRTVDGWERPQSWYTQPVALPRLHPLVVAAGQILLSALGMAASAHEYDSIRARRPG
jgi:hypothetical protein